jgi:hypothetical protein
MLATDGVFVSIRIQWLLTTCKIYVYYISRVAGMDVGKQNPAIFALSGKRHPRRARAVQNGCGVAYPECYRKHSQLMIFVSYVNNYIFNIKSYLRVARGFGAGNARNKNAGQCHDVIENKWFKKGAFAYARMFMKTKAVRRWTHCRKARILRVFADFVPRNAVFGEPKCSLLGEQRQPGEGPPAC